MARDPRIATPEASRRAPFRTTAALVALFLAVGLASAASAAVPWSAAAAGPGDLIDSPDGTTQAELLRFDEGLAPALLALPPEGALRVAGWPVAPGTRADVLLTRHEVYAPDARIYRADGERMTELPRSTWVFFWGEAEGDPTIRVSASVDPATGTFRGVAETPQGVHELQPLPASGPLKGAPGQHLVAPPEFFRDAVEGSAPPTWSCGEEEFPALAGDAPLLPPPADAIATLHTATVAVDTDNELLAQKFADNTTSATNYLASLFAAMNVMYERDLLVRLVQGTTILRVSSSPDPWASTAGGSASSAQLQEFGNWWSANQGSTQRALAMLLSGKQSSSNSASGIGWVNGLCSTGFGYSVSQVFKINFLSGDAQIVGHELGHNFGSPHTHCYSPPIDTCRSGEGSGCYSGPQSCPAPATIGGLPNVTGTIMSYCHLLGGGCSSSLVFHPRSVDLIAPLVASKVGICIFPNGGGGGGAPALTRVSPNSGSTAGGTTVTISGTGFLAGATVTVGGSAATNVSVASPQTITARVPAHATGAVAVAVTNPGGLSGTLSNAFFYAPPSAALSFFTVTPCRVIDTRNPNGSLGGPALGANAQRTFKVTGVCGIPAGAKYVSANLTVVTPPAGGFLGVYPGNAFPFGTSAMNFSPGKVRANNALILLATDGAGTVGIQNNAAGATHVLLDVNGYFQ